MLKFFKNHFFRVTFLIYVLVLGILVSGVYFMFINQQTIIQKEKVQKDSLAKAELMVKIADEKFYMIEQIAIQVSNSRWKTYAASKSDVLYSQLDYFKKMEICQQIETLNVILQIAKSTAVIFPQKNVAVDGSSFWEIERYLKAIGLNEKWSGVLEEILTDSDKSMKILAEKQVGNDNGNFIVVKNLTQNTISGDALFVFVDGKYFQKFININMMDVTYFAICLDGETIYATKQVNLEDQVQEVRLSSELYPWEYSFLVRVNNKESEIGNIYYI